jgi:hypothetical protein
MPYHLEKGPLLSVLDSFFNSGSDARLVNALTKLRTGVPLDSIGVFDSPNLYSPAFPFPYRRREDLVGHFNTHWLGQAPLNVNTDGRQTGHWQFYSGPVEAIMRETLIRALELVLGVRHDPDGPAPTPTRHWTIDFWWKCPQPWFEGWVTWRNTTSAGHVTVIFATPSDDGVVLRNPSAEATLVAADVATATEGSWLVSSKTHTQVLQLTSVWAPPGQLIFPTTWTIDPGPVVVLAPNLGSGGARDHGFPYREPS